MSKFMPSPVTGPHTLHHKSSGGKILSDWQTWAKIYVLSVQIYFRVDVLHDEFSKALLIFWYFTNRSGQMKDF